MDRGPFACTGLVRQELIVGPAGSRLVRLALVCLRPIRAIVAA
jgi:hypothetical protein